MIFSTSHSSFSASFAPRLWQSYRSFSQRDKMSSLVKDGVFKALFFDEKDPSKLIHFLQAVRPEVPGKRIERIEFQNPYFPAYSPGEKDIFVDVICKSFDEDGKNPEIHVVEMQQVENEGFIKRWEFYASRCFTMELLKTKTYENLVKVNVVAVMSHPCKYPNDHYKLVGQSTGVPIKESRELTILSLHDLSPDLSDEDTASKKWSHLIKFSGTPNLQEKVLSNHPIFSKAMEDLKSMRKTDVPPLKERISRGKPWKLLHRQIQGKL